MLNKPMPPITTLHSLFELDAERGVLIRRNSHGSHKAGEICGTAMKLGHLQTCVEKKRYLVHRIIYFMATAVDPGEMVVDHVNGNPQDNRIANLRLATKADNCRHKVKLASVNRSGHRNVSWSNTFNCWLVSVRREGRSKTRRCKTLEEAAATARELRRHMYGNFCGVTT